MGDTGHYGSLEQEMDSTLEGKYSEQDEGAALKLKRCYMLERKKWISWLLFDDHERTTSMVTGEPLLVVIDKALQHHKQNPAVILLLLATWRINWSERNDAEFQHKSRYRGINILIREIREEIEAMLHKTHLSDRLQTIWAQAQHTADYWEEQMRRWLAGATKREPRSQHRSPSTQASPDREANNATDPRSPFHASTGWNDNEMIRWDARESSRCNEAPTMALQSRSEENRPPTEWPNGAYWIRRTLPDD
ncbi:hypothetical protein R1sor_022111 [Riccia sorocarpa]|uniref:Uncharacterized protein n=1 Tax=Riccia sorocarpa TaxID=122646 RepID=A0ABD3GIX1_9MARC